MLEILHSKKKKQNTEFVNANKLRERNRTELELYLTDYKSQIQTADTQIEIQHQVFTLTITAIGFMLAVTPYIIQYELTIIYWLASLVFYGLALTQLRHVKTVFAIIEYLKNSLIPKIQGLLNRLTPTDDNNCSEIFSWVTSEHLATYSEKLWELPIEAARYLISVVAGLSCLLAYWFIPAPRIILREYILLSINIIWPFYIIIFSLRLRSIHILGKK